MKIAFLFPGQGTQYLNMGKDFYQSFSEAKEIIDHACDILKYDLKKVLFLGPQDKLTETKYAQVAIFVVSVVMDTILQKQFPTLTPSVVAGLSLGEYSALTAGKYLDFTTCLQLVSTRSNLMHAACDAKKGGMLVVLGLEPKEVEKIIIDLELPEDLWIANLNCPGQIVVSGTPRGLTAFSDCAKERGVKRVVPLQVHGAFHSGMMLDAQDKLEPHIDLLELQPGIAPIAMNASGSIEKDLNQIKYLLKKQVTGSVYWQKSVEEMNKMGTELYIEIGPGNVLSGLNKRIGVKGKSLSIEAISDLETLSFTMEKKELI